MSCMKCGSEWVTKKGKDMVSCPECCKQQRCKARKQGRLPAEEQKTCERCGVAFTASGANAMARSRYCSSCAETARQEYIRDRKAGIKSGEWKVKPQRKMKGRKCLRCGKELSKNQSKYCGCECFNAAKKQGIQSWDRTGQLESIWHRGGRWACAPSRKPIQEMRHNMHAFMRKVRRMTIAILSLCPTACKTCGCHNTRPSSCFCSNECASRDASERSCKHCGVRFVSVGAYGAQARVCNACKKRARQEVVRRRNKKYGRNHRQRARHHGVRYKPVPVKSIYERDNYTCQICSRKCLPKARMHRKTGKIHPMSPSIDHIVPMSRGGNHVEANLQTACFRCNTLKSNKGGGQLRLPVATITPPARGD